MSTVSNLEMWSLVIGFFLPPVLALAQQSRWPSWLRAVVTFVVCLVAGAGVSYWQGDLTGRRWTEAALVVLVATIATFKGFWKPTGIAPAIEAKTSF